MNELISVIVPIYNVKQYLDTCVESIINQTYKNLEIILVDDGSTDGCGPLCDEWAQQDQRIKVIHKENGGLSDARNAGVKRATGPIISYVDSDDWLAEDMIERVYEAMLSENALVAGCQFAAVCEGKVENVPHTGKVIVFTGQELVGRIISNEQSPRLSNSVWKFIFRREAIENIEFEKGRFYEDALYTIPVCYEQDVIPFVDEPLYFYRQRQDSIMGVKLTAKHVDDMLHYQEGIYDYLVIHGKNRDLVNHRINMCKMVLEYRYLCAKDKNLSKSYDLLTANIKRLNITKTDKGSLSMQKYIAYRYFPKLLARIKR